MDIKDLGRVPAAPGSTRSAPEDRNGLRPAGNDPSRLFWIELREPRCVPDRKGPYPRRMMTGVIRDCLKYRPTAYITVITWHDQFGPLLTDGPEWLMMRDGRSRSTALAHIRHTAEAHRDSDRHPDGPRQLAGSGSEATRVRAEGIAPTGPSS